MGNTDNRRMKVLDLQCANGHLFEGWFGSEDDFQAQSARHLVTCPVCNDATVHKRLSAPRLNLGHGGEPAPSPSSTPAGRGAEDPPLARLQAAWLRMARQVIAQTEDVGERFVSEARRMHHGDIPSRGIRGQVTAMEAAELLDEGVEILPLPLPEALKGPLQ